MYCKKCGKEIDYDSVFCTYCGQRKQSIESTKYTNKDKILQANLKSRSKTKSKIDNNYKRDFSPTIIGIILIIANFVTLTILDINSNEDGYRTFGIIHIIGRIVVAIMIFNIAEKLNRSTIGWAAFGLFLPAPALISIGLMKRKKGLYDNVESIDINEQLRLLDGKDDNFSLKIQNIRNKEIHDITVKEWKEFIKAGTFKDFKLVKWE